jgi:hypothetical protein
MVFGEKSIVLLLMLFFAVCNPVFASDPCGILEAGNEYYGKDNSRAIEIFRTVEHIDRVGKDRCTASIYATLGTMYKIEGDKASNSSDHERVIFYYKLSLKYNRAFANALICNGGDCSGSEELWEESSFWSK